MGTALRNKAKEDRLGGRGVGKLTNDKCTHLQNYYRDAILNNLGNQEAMNHAIWASLFHCCSTDEDPTTSGAQMALDPGVSSKQPLLRLVS